MGANRIIIHADMDSFFAAVEGRERPEHRGKPIIVGADPKGGRGRGVVSTCNYEARKYGVRSGMPISRAWKLCPGAVYLPVDLRLYEKVSSDVMEILRRHADKFEQVGIDEAFLDVSSLGNFENAKRLAQEIKMEIFEREKITCSIGIGPNKLVAKMASDFKMPDGLTVILPDEVKQFLSPLPVGKLWGVGRKTEQKLNEMGVKTISELAAYDPSVLIEEFGALGTHFHLMAQGLDRSEVEEREEIKSVGREFTFEEDTSDLSAVLETLDALSQEVHREIEGSNLYFKTVTVKVRYENFETHTHSKTLPFFTNRLRDIQRTARELVQPFLRSNRKVRLIGARVSNLASGERQKTLRN